MVSLHLSSMWQSRMMQKYCPSSLVCHRQQIPWVRNATCKFSKSTGPVRYAPKSTKQPENEQDEGVKSPQYFVKETDKQVPLVPSHQHVVKEAHNRGSPVTPRAHRFQDPGLAELLSWGCDLARQHGETGIESDFSLDEGKEVSSSYVKPPHILETRGDGAQDSNGSSVHSGEVFEANTNAQGMPITYLDSLQKASGNYQKEASTFKEEENRDTISSRMHAAEVMDKGSRQLQGSSADFAKMSLSRTRQQNRGKEAGDGVSPIFEQGNGLVEKAQKKKKNPFAFMDSNVEGETCSQAVQAISSLPILGKHPMKREPDIRDGKRLPSQDVEGFILKVQKAKREGLESHNKSHSATSAEGDLYIDNNYEGGDIDDDSCLFLGKETFQKNEDVGLVSKSTAAQENAKNRAVRYLAMRPYTAFQLKKKLESREISSELADYAIATVQKCGLQSDLSYAETFSRARFNHSSWGPQRIKLGLQQRGISKEIIEVAIANVFREEENGTEQCETCERDTMTTADKMSRAAMDHLLVQATKQWNRGRDATTETKVRRMVFWLQYRGFNYSVIKAVLRHLQQPY